MTSTSKDPTMSDDTKPVKLTKAQGDLLFDLTMGTVLVGINFQPALDLVALKLATKKAAIAGCIRVSITRAGKQHAQAGWASASPAAATK